MTVAKFSGIIRKMSTLGGKPRRWKEVRVGKEMRRNGVDVEVCKSY